MRPNRRPKLTIYRAASNVSRWQTGLNRIAVFEPGPNVRVREFQTIGAYVVVAGRCVSLVWARPS